MSRIFISAGHTILAPGAVHGKFREADLTRKIAAMVVTELEQLKLPVQAVPLDLPMLQRIQWINNIGANEQDICIEIHINDSDGTQRGIESWYEGKGENNSQRLATILNDTISKLTGYENHGAHSEFEHELRSLTFVNRTNSTTVLLETLYLDNELDKQILDDDAQLQKLATAVAKGIQGYLGNTSNTNSLSTDQQDLKPESPVQVAPPMRPPISGNNSIMMDREQRKQMITDNYLKILGRKPSTTDLNYFLNMGVSETELVKKMAESQEHLDILKAKMKVEELEKELQELKLENIRHKAAIGDQKRLLDELNKLVAHKNNAIRELEKTIRETQGLPSHILNRMQQTETPSEVRENRPIRNNNHNPKEKVFHYLAKRVS